MDLAPMLPVHPFPLEIILTERRGSYTDQECRGKGLHEEPAGSTAEWLTALYLPLPLDLPSHTKVKLWMNTNINTT